MDLPSLLRAPRICWLAGRTFWVRPLTLDDWGMLLAWFDDVLPGYADRKQPPCFGADEAQEALYSPTGYTIIAWIALRHEMPSFDEVASIIAEATDEERLRLLTVVFGRRRTLKPGADGDDIATTWWGPVICSTEGLIEAYPALTFEAIGRLSLDQLDCLMSRGVPHEDPVRDQLVIFDRIARENRAKAEAAKEAETLPFQGDS